ncbi:helix-turn-helix transcriptional regulator [Streptomyces smyrnaeus]|uniref:helix-turn-helix transcriptional regulator n=1 Tax=Streptomyces smyrnaeus TaxID=1387713 RepID=UPI0033FB1B48
MVRHRAPGAHPAARPEVDPKPDRPLERRRPIGRRSGSDGCGADLTQEGLRELSGVGRTTVRRIEAGNTDARLNRLPRVASVPDVPLTDLVRE